VASTAVETTEPTPPVVRTSTVTVGPYEVAGHHQGAGHQHGISKLLSDASSALSTLAGGRLKATESGDFRITFPEPIWLLGLETKIVTPGSGEVLDELNCHTFLKAEATEDWWKTEEGVIGQHTDPFKGMYTDGYTQALKTPEGFGIYYGTDEPVEFVPRFNNRSVDPFDASVEAKVEYILASELNEPLTPLYSVFLSVVHPMLYLVEPGGNVREREYRFPVDGTIHMMGVHVHPYARSIELINGTRDESVWLAEAELDAEGMVREMPIYSSSEGYRVSSDETYTLRVTYGNPTEETQDAMGGLAVFFAPDGNPAELNALHESRS